MTWRTTWKTWKPSLKDSVSNRGIFLKLTPHCYYPLSHSTSLTHTPDQSHPLPLTLQRISHSPSSPTPSSSHHFANHRLLSPTSSNSHHFADHRFLSPTLSNSHQFVDHPLLSLNPFDNHHLAQKILSRCTEV